MKYAKSQKIAWTFFATCMGLFSLQILYGFILGFDRMGMDGLHDLIPFNTARATHTNLLVVWMLAGFMGSAYYIIPRESEREIWSPKLAWIQWASLSLVGVVAVVGYHFNYWEGRKFLEIPRPLDYLVVVNVLAFLFNLLMTI
jgi:nitric oxide reductase subunit B